MNAEWFAKDALKLLARAKEEIGKRKVTDSTHAYWNGVYDGVMCLIDTHAWNQLDTTTKREINPVRFEEERVASRAKAKERRVQLAARVKHLGEAHSWLKDRSSTSESYTLCEGYIYDTTSAQTPKDGWLDSHHVVRPDARITEVTCKACLEKADVMKIPGAFKQLQKILRKEEAA